MSTSDKESKNESKKNDARRITTPSQIDLLIDFMRDNEELRSGRVKSKEIVQISRQLWDTCTEELNKLGPSRNAKEWARYWSDMKSRLKVKVVEINKRALESGDGFNIGLTLTAAEKRILDMLHHDRQHTRPLTHEILFETSAGPSVESINYTLVKEEIDESLAQQQDMNIEEFIGTAPIVAQAVSPVKKTVNLPHFFHPYAHGASGVVPRRSTSCLPYQPLQGSGFKCNKELSPIGQRGPSVKRPQSVPPRVSSSPKGRPRPRVIQSRPGRSRRNLPCPNCTDLKEFVEAILKLEDSHSKTARLQIENSAKMTEVLKMQAEGLMHSGIALRELANNISRLMEGQINSGRPAM